MEKFPHAVAQFGVKELVSPVNCWHYFGEVFHLSGAQTSVLLGNVDGCFVALVRHLGLANEPL